MKLSLRELKIYNIIENIEKNSKELMKYAMQALIVEICPKGKTDYIHCIFKQNIGLISILIVFNNDFDKFAIFGTTPKYDLNDLVDIISITRKGEIIFNELIETNEIDSIPQLTFLGMTKKQLKELAGEKNE